MAFAPAPEYEVWPTGRDLTPYEAAVRAVEETRARSCAEFDPHAVVVGHPHRGGRPGGARWRAGRGPRWSPMCCPRASPGCRPTRWARACRGRGSGRARGGCCGRCSSGGEERGRRELNGARRQRGPAGPRPHPRRDLAAAGDGGDLPAARVPALRPRPLRAGDRAAAVGEALRRGGGPPPGDEPLVLVAPSTSQDPSHAMLRAALEGLAGEPRAGAGHDEPARAPHPSSRAGERPGGRLALLRRTMPRCAAVICHAGHGTVARSLASGVPVIGCPAAGDMAENAARLAWSGCGISLPRRLVTARGIRLAVRKLLAEPGYTEQGGRAACVERAPRRRRGGGGGGGGLGRLKLRGWDSNPQPIG